VKKSHTDQSEPRAYHHGDLRRALVLAALALVTEEQDWAFSLREVARRAGVSHNAPYNHFADRRDLLVAVAVAGLEALRERMLAAVAGLDDPAAALVASGQAYVRAGVDNPALYRLIFGSALAAHGARPAAARAAGARTREVLERIVERGARDRVFAIADDSNALAIATLSAWSAMHGLTMLAIDGFADLPLSADALAARIGQTVLNGLRPR
jgi:AcrR family transcriptional regulator